LLAWLTVTYTLARPLAAGRVPPDAITLLGLVVALIAGWLASLGGGWPAAAAVVVALSGVVDGLDGAVAVLTGRTSRWGAVLDSLVDRLADTVYLAAFWVLGAPAALCLAGGLLTWSQEYARARAGAVGLPDVGVVTVAERPTRVLVAAMFLLGAGLFPPDAAAWASGGAAAWVATGVVGVVQLLVVLRRRLGPGRADQAD
jgi:CDP-diacylglycerol--glycerol-3-phosphate 3-phosphatidyltransferase